VQVLVQCLTVVSVLCLVAGAAAFVSVRPSSPPGLGMRAAATLLFPVGMIFFGIALILAAEAELSLRGEISIGAGEGAQFGIFHVAVGVIWFGIGVFRLIRRSSK
jgi:hypothetical protein